MSRPHLGLLAVLATTLAAGAACEINPPVDSGSAATGGSTAGMTGGSGGAGASTGKDLSRFIGVWFPLSATITTACSDQTSESHQSGANVVWSAGTSSDLVQPIAGTGCSVPANVQSNTASLVGSPTCTFAAVAVNGDALTVTETINSYEFVVAPDGLTATEDGSANEIITDAATQQTTTCVVTERAGSYQKS